MDQRTLLQVNVMVHSPLDLSDGLFRVNGLCKELKSG